MSVLRIYSKTIKFGGQKMDKKQRELTEEQIRIKQTQLEQLKYEVEEANLRIEQFQRMLDLKLPEKRVRVEMNDLKLKLGITERNIKILEKQVRERREVILA